jgi:hypothetical protein
MHPIVPKQIADQHTAQFTGTLHESLDANPVVEVLDMEVSRAEALFVSSLQPSQRPTPDQIREAIGTTLRRWGARGCAAAVAEEFGQRPETAARRMAWALSIIRTLHATVPSEVGHADAA